MKIMVLWKERPTRSKSVLSAVAADECGVCLMRHTEVQTTSVCLSSVPLVSRICPSDTYRVWKSGQCLRVDTTLMGFEQMTWQRGNRSFIFRGQGQGLNSTVNPQYMHDRSARLHSYWEILPILLYYMIIRYIFFLFFLLQPSTWVSDLNHSLIFLLSSPTDSRAEVMEVDHDRQLVFCETLPVSSLTALSPDRGNPCACSSTATSLGVLGGMQPSDEQVAARLTAPVVTTQLDTRNIAFERSGIFWVTAPNSQNIKDKHQGFDFLKSMQE